jgi:hypothetical protein
VPANFTSRSRLPRNVDVTTMLNDRAVEMLTVMPPTKRAVGWILAVRSLGANVCPRSTMGIVVGANHLLRVSLMPSAPPIDSRIMQQ